MFRHAYGHHWGYGIGPLGGILMLAVFLAAGALVAWAIVRYTTRHTPPVAPPAVPPGPRYDPALEQLRLRYARGEISADEYRAVAHDLGYPAPPAGPSPGSPPPRPPAAGAAAGPASTGPFPTAS